MFNVSVLLFSVFQSFRLPTIIARSPSLSVGFFFIVFFLFPGAATCAGDSFQILSSEFCRARACTRTHTQLQVKKNDQRPGSVTLQPHWRGNTAMKGLGSDWSVSSSIAARLFLLRVRTRGLWGGEDGCGCLAGRWGGMSRQAPAY